MVTIEIDGQKIETEPGTMVIQVADKAGIHIPRFCYHKKLSVAANCRMCLVDVAKAPKPMPACATPVMDGMVVLTKSPKALLAQKAVMEFLLINHPLDCPICDQGGECELQDVAMGYGDDVSRFNLGKRAVGALNLGPLVATEMTRCIHCTRCVRFGTEIAGRRELGATGRGEHMEITTYLENNLDSELSGNVIDLCPVGALTSKPFRFRARSWEMKQFAGVAPHDGIGSHLFWHSHRQSVVRVVPREQETLNETWLSDRDRFSYEGLGSAKRLLQPMVKENNSWKLIPWDLALTYAADALKNTIEKHGPESLGALLHPNCTVEEGFLVQKLLRELGSDNIDCRLRQADFSGDATLKLKPWSADLAALETAPAITIIGMCPRTAAPILAHRLRRAAQKGVSIQYINATTVPAGEFATAVMAFKGVPNGHIIVGGEVFAHPEGDSLRTHLQTISKSNAGFYHELPFGANALGLSEAGVMPRTGKSVRDMLSQSLAAYLLVHCDPVLDTVWGKSSQAALSGAEHIIAITAFQTESVLAHATLLLPAGVAPETSGTFVNALGMWQNFVGAAKPPGEARPVWKIIRVLANMLGVSGFEYESTEQVLTELKAQGPYASDACALPLKPSVTPVNGLVWVAPLGLYHTDNMVRHAEALSHTADAKRAYIARLHPGTAAANGLHDNHNVRITTSVGSVETLLAVDDTIPQNTLYLESGTHLAATLGQPFQTVKVEAV